MALSYGMRSKGISTVLPCISRLRPLTTPAFSLPAEAGPHLSTPEGRKAELAWVAGYILR